METAMLTMMGTLLVMMGALFAMMAGLFLKMVDLAGRIGRVEAMLGTQLRHTHDPDTGQAVAPVPLEAYRRSGP